MASISEILIGQASKAIESTGNQKLLSDGIKEGAQMRQGIEQLALEREKLEQNKEKMKQEKEKVLFDMIGNYISNADKVAGIKGLSPQRKEQILLGMRDSMPAIKDFIPEDTVKMQIADPNVKAKIAQAQSDLKLGKIDFGTYTKVLSDAVALDSYGADPSFYFDEALEGGGKAEDTRIGAEAQRNAVIATNNRAEDAINAAEKRQKTEIEAVGEKTLAANIAKDFGQFKTDGGLSGAQKKLNQLKEVLNDLKTGKVVTGDAKTLAATSTPFVGGNTLLAKVNPKLKAAQDKVRASVSLKGTLDSQFSSKEAQEAYALRFDPNLPTKENITKVQAMIDELQGDLDNKAEIFRSRGYDVGGIPQSKKAEDEGKKAAKVQFEALAKQYASDPAKLKAIKERAAALGITLENK